ncbi:restriction endonuclease subunit S domain-containing protein [Chthoniobacter flavus]|nr:hypothetical protein [Chthoniobacter flavus]
MDSQHGEVPEVEHSRCIRPADVLITKIAPIRAAWVMPVHHRHPVDANCIILRGLDRSVAFWWLLWLNTAAFTDMLVRRSGAAVLPRLRLSVLRDLALPPPPAVLAPLAQEAWVALAALAEADTELMRLHGEVGTTVENEVARTSWNETASRYGAPTWCDWFSCELIDDSLVPVHVAANAQAETLHRDADWQRLPDLVFPTPSERLGETGQPVRTLRLSDVRRSFDLNIPDEPRSTSAGSRLYGRPLHAGDVLMSTLGSDPRVAWLADDPPAPVFAVDHWARLRFHDTPGAWALILATEPVARQIRLFTSGTAQQFIRAADLAHVFLPRFPHETLVRWERTLARVLRRRNDLHGQWRSVLHRARAIQQATLRRP